MPHPVQLALYDLSRGLARQMSMAIIGKHVEGIWHTGIIVYGHEYFFGGGLQRMRHEDFVHSHGGFRPDRYLELGSTEVPEEVFLDWFRGAEPRFTVASYDLLRWNCNNFTNEAALFLLGEGIPDYIVNLPSEVLNSPGGAFLRPMLESMTTQMNGADPLGGSTAHAAHATATPPAPAAPFAAAASPFPAAAAQRPRVPVEAGPVTGTVGAGAAATAKGYPTLDRHSRPLVSAGVAAVKPVLAKLRTLAVETAGPAGNVAALGAEDLAALEVVAAAAATGPDTPLPPGTFPLLLKLLHPGHRELQFPLLCLLRLLVLHRASGDRAELVERFVTAGYICQKLAEHADDAGPLETALAAAETAAVAAEIAAKMGDTAGTAATDGAAGAANGAAEEAGAVAADGPHHPPLPPPPPEGLPASFFSGPGLSMAMCTAANLFAAPDGGAELMLSAPVRTGCVDAGLRGLRHARPDVRQFAGALLHNYALALAASPAAAAATAVGMPAAAPAIAGTGVVEVLATAVVTAAAVADSGSAGSGGAAEGAAAAAAAAAGPSEEATQLLFGCLEALGEEMDAVVGLRRLLAAGRVGRAFPELAGLAREVGLDEEVRLILAAATAAAAGPGGSPVAGRLKDPSGRVTADLAAAAGEVLRVIMYSGEVS